MPEVPDDIEEISASPFAARERDRIQSVIFTAIGEASMCWDRTPNGVFDSTLAIRVGKQLLSEIERIMLQTKGDN